MTQEDIDYVVQQLTKQFTKWSEVDRGAALKDRVVVDYYFIFEGKAEFDHKLLNNILLNLEVKS